MQNFCEMDGNTMKRDYEMIILKNKRRRQKQLRIYKMLILFFASVALIMTIAITSRAASGGHQTYFKYYTGIIVQPGDTLNSIASRYMDSIHYGNSADYVDELKLMNNLDDSMTAHPGDYLIVPYYSTVFKK